MYTGEDTDGNSVTGTEACEVSCPQAAEETVLASTSPAPAPAPTTATDPPGNDDDKPILSEEEAKAVASEWQDLLANTQVCLTTGYPLRSACRVPALHLNHPKLYSPKVCARSSRRQMYGIILLVQVGLTCLGCISGVAALTVDEGCRICLVAFNCCSCCCVIPVIYNVVRTA
jgi:hypothetical protein